MGELSNSIPVFCSTTLLGGIRMAIYVKTDEQGLPTAFFDTSFYDYDVPSGAIEITDAQHEELLSFQGQRRIVNGQVIEYVPPAPPIVTVLPAVTLWERLTEAEAEQVIAAMATQPFRTRQIFLTANTFRSDHELWPLLVQMANDLFGEARAAELLSPA